MRVFSILFWALTASVSAETISLLPKTGLEGWSVDIPKGDGSKTFYLEDGMLKTTGKPLGHLYTEQAFGNYVLTIEYRYPEKAGNCGVMVHSTAKGFLKGVFPRSIEVQLMSGKAGDIIAIGENVVGYNGKSTPKLIGQAKTRYLKRLVLDAENQVGEWNTMVILAMADTLTTTVNGHLMNVIKDCSVSKGMIALQSEGAPVEFRRLDLTPLPKK